MTVRRLLLSLFLLLATSSSALAVEPSERLADPALEARARAISRDVRCMVCQNQSIDDSDADLARDLRLIVRQRLVAGDSDAEVRGYLVARYGDFVLLSPPVKPTTWILWFGPLVVLIAAAAGLFFHLRHRRSAMAAPSPLTAAEQQRLRQLLERDGPSS